MNARLRTARVARRPRIQLGGSLRSTAVAVPATSRAGTLRLLSELALRVPPLTRRLTHLHATVYVWTRGRLFGRWFGLAILVLETVGRRSGKPRRVPVAYLPDGENLVVVPANGGAHRAPAWWLNLLAAGDGVAVLGRDRRRIRPYEASGAERERLWRRFAAASPVDRYQRRTSRRIPVVVLVCTGAGQRRGRFGGDVHGPALGPQRRMTQ
jgi:deazaflavin-dependent oxidoreductase (nitroreductase family)